jgi:hypothetical protein
VFTGLTPLFGTHSKEEGEIGFRTDGIVFLFHFGDIGSPSESIACMPALGCAVYRGVNADCNSPRTYGKGSRQCRVCAHQAGLIRLVQFLYPFPAAAST